MDLPGEPIPGSRYFRAFCAGCREPIRVEQPAAGPVYCDECDDPHQLPLFGGDFSFKSAMRDTDAKSVAGVLTTRQFRSLSLWTDGGKTQYEIGRMHGIGRTGVAMRISRARDRLSRFNLPVPERYRRTPRKTVQASVIGSLFEL